VSTRAKIFWNFLSLFPPLSLALSLFSRRYKSLAESARSRTRWIARCSFRTIPRFFCLTLEFFPFFFLSCFFRACSCAFPSSPLIQAWFLATKPSDKALSSNQIAFSTICSLIKTVKETLEPVLAEHFTGLRLFCLFWSPSCHLVNALSRMSTGLVP
jgi:hypothetical protein